MAFFWLCAVSFCFSVTQKKNYATMFCSLSYSCSSMFVSLHVVCAEFCWAWGLDKWNQDSALETFTCGVCKQSKWHSLHFFFVSCVHVVLHNNMLKADQDESVRLWNVHTGICILIFAGAGGHRNEVLSVVSGDRKELCIHCTAAQWRHNLMF